MTETSEEQSLDLNQKKRSLNIEIVTETYPPEINGVAHTISMLVQGLRKNNNTVSVIRPRQKSDQISQKDNFINRDCLVNSLPIPLYPELRMGMPKKNFLITRWGKNRPDIVHIATEGPLGWSAVKAARELNIPVTSDFRTNFHSYSSLYKVGFLKPLIMAYMKHMHNATDCTMVPTQKLSRDLQTSGINNLIVMPRGVDTTQFSTDRRSNSLRRSWNVEPSDVVLLCVGRLAVEKNLDLLIKSYKHAQAVDSSTKLVVVGDGPLRKSLECLCADAIFAGIQRGTSLAEYYASADVFVFPSMTETFGNVTIEAMASGLAVVAYDLAGAGELIQSTVNGIVVEPNNEPAFIEAVQSIVMNKSLIQKLGQQALHTAHQNSWEEIISRTEEIFKQVVDVKKSSQACHENFIIQT